MVSGLEHSFHEVPAELQHHVLRSRKGVGDYLGWTQGLAGRIHKFKTGTVVACVKLPLAKTISSKEAATRFLRELRLQRAMFFHEFVHWPSDFDLVLDTPIAWFRFWHSDLAALVEVRDFTFEGRLAMLAYVATGLVHCHTRGLIAHQDLKPENIFVFDMGRQAADLPDANVWHLPKLADFGSANPASVCGEYGGTKAYMAPEQWNSLPLGPHTSVWSLGLIAYELLSFGEHPVGEPTRPWRNRAAGVLNRWQDKKMWLRWLDAGCRPAGSVREQDADTLISRCLQIDPALRPSLREFINTILALLRRRSPSDAMHATFRISNASDVSQSDHAWPYLDYRYNLVVKDLAKRFGDMSIIDDYLISKSSTTEMVERHTASI